MQFNTFLKVYMSKHLLIGVLSTLPLLCQGQGPVLQSTNPARQTLVGNRNGPVQLTFSGPVANPAAIRVNGDQRRGQLTGAFSGAGTRQIAFQSAQPFAPGERVSVTVPASVSSPAQVIEFRMAAGRGQATFGSPVMVGSPLNTQPTVAVAGDLDNDGDIDLLLGEEVAGRVCLNDGHGQFTAQTTRVDIISYADELRLGDFNGDGNLDVVASSGRGNAEVSLSLGTGQGTFLPRTALLDGLTRTQLATGDFNADGLMDVALSTPVGTGVELRMLLGSKNGPLTISSMQVLALPARDIGAADMDEDGDIDLLLVSDALLGVYQNDGTGRFSAGQTIEVNPYSGTLTVGDFTGDGHVDVVCSSHDTPNVSLVPGTGTGGLEAVRSIYVLSRNWQVSSGDMDGDADLDLLVTNDRGITQVLLNRGNGEFTASAILLGFEAFIIADAADLNGDGLLDVYTAHGVSNPRAPHGIDVFYNQPLTVTRATTPLASPTLTVFPNPAHAQVTVVVPRSEHPTNLTIHDLLGRIVSTRAVAASNASQQLVLSLLDLPAGVYQARAQTPVWQAVQRVVVE